MSREHLIYMLARQTDEYLLYALASAFSLPAHYETSGGMYIAAGETPNPLCH